MQEPRAFLQRAAVKAQDDQHRLKILKAIHTYTQTVEQRKQTQFRDWQQARRLAAQIKNHVLARLPDLLEQFEERITARGAKVYWAETAADARETILDIVARRQARVVVKSKSMTTEEIGLNEALQQAGVEVWESDLGELIVQVAGEKPYHIVTPAMHKNREDVARLFHEKLGAPLTQDVEQLTMIAREHLRHAYVTAEIGITGANFILAEEGAIVMTENEGNGRLTMACPPVHVVLVGIEKVLPSMRELALFLPLLATSGTGQQITCYNSIVRGPRQPGEPDGPEEMHIILLDNGRAELFAQPEFQHVLRCIRCGACLNACPVYRTIGGHAYNTPYQGPIGSVITPHLRGFGQWYHLPFASSLCGACSDVCPVNIDLHHLLLWNRHRAVEREHTATPGWRLAMKLWAWGMRRRQRLERLRPWLRLGMKLFRPLLPDAQRRRVPPMAEHSFARLWRDHERQKSHS